MHVRTWDGRHFVPVKIDTCVPRRYEKLRQRKRKADQYTLLQKSHDFTAALQRTRAQLKDEIARSGQALGVLENSTKTLEETQEE